MPLKYNGDLDLEYLMNKLYILAQHYSLYYNMIKGYFIEIKLQYFKDKSFNYNKFSKDIMSNSILERYNKTIKKELGEKGSCNLVIFPNFINNELSRINKIQAKNENVNILYNMKLTKFEKNK